MRLEGKTVLVIGGTGFVGCLVVEQLAQAGARVKVLARNAPRAGYLKPLGGVGQIALLGGDALNDEVLADAIKGSDIVINTIGILAERGKQRFEAIQAELPKRIGKIATKFKVKRVIHLSAIGADIGSKSRYASSKGRGEANLKKSFRKATILRPSLIFGAGDSFFNRFGKMATYSIGLPVIGGGRNKVQPVYVGDVAEAVKAVLADEKTQGKIYELGGAEILTFKEVMAYIIKTINRRRLLIPIPHWLMMLAALPMGLLPNPPVTRDQLRQLKYDNIVSDKALKLKDLGITPRPVDLIVPQYLERYRP